MSARWPLLSARITAGYPGRPEVLRDLRFDIRPGEVLGLVGQSGAGKSTLALALLRLMGHRGGTASGEIWFEGRDLMRASERELRDVRGRAIAMVPQSPLTALNPALRIGVQMEEAFRAHARAAKPERLGRVLETLALVSLPAENEFLRRYPDQLSVGQAQRVLIAMALLHRPSLLLADEPTSALDVITQAEILRLFARLNREHGATILYISHDLLSMAALATRIGILHQGRLAETGPTEQIFRRPAHPYTRSLIAAIPRDSFGDNAAAESIISAPSQ